MIKKIILWTLFAGFAGVLVFGAINRTEARNDSGNGEGRSGTVNDEWTGSGKGGQGTLTDVESDEWVEVVNVGDLPLDVTGWKLQDDDGNVFVFAGVVMQPGQACRLYTHRQMAQARAPRNYLDDDCGFDWKVEQPIWGNSGDIMELIAPDGAKAECRCWANGCKLDQAKGCQELTVACPTPER